jgi:hypothetical protein
MTVEEQNHGLTADHHYQSSRLSQSRLPSESWLDADVRIPRMESTMNVQVQPRVTTAERRLPFECVALVLQGGDALGAYQAGVYEALDEAGVQASLVSTLWPFKSTFGARGASYRAA